MTYYLAVPDKRSRLMK